MNLRQIFNIPKTLTVYVDNQRTDSYVPNGSINKPYKTLKEAYESITDSSSTKRYAVVVKNGFYYEDNPITIKNYVYTQGDFKHNPRIIPLNQDEPLFTHPAGYSIYDFGELSFVAPKNNVIFYAGAGAWAVGGFYYNLFMAQDGAGSESGQTCEAFHHEEADGGYHLINCMCYSEYWNNAKFTTFANIINGNYRDTGMHIHDGTIMDNYLRLDGEGHCEIDLLLTDTDSIETMYYINSIDTRLMLSNQVSSKPGGKTIHAEEGNIRIRNCDMWGENYFGDCSTVSLQTSEFLNDGYIYAYKPTELIVTQCKNINTTTYCLYCLGENTRIHTTGNSFTSPLGTMPVQLEGTFISIEAQGVSQYDVDILEPGAEETFEHLPDMSYARVCQVSRYSSGKDDSLDFDTAKEAEYYQEDEDKTKFDVDKIQLEGIVISDVYAHWHLNELLGTNVEDSSGNERNGITQNMDDSNWVVGKLNNCLNFDGINEYVNCGNIANFERTDTFSFDFWMKAEFNFSAQQIFLSKNISTNNRGWLIYKPASSSSLYFDLRHIYSSNTLSVSCNPSIWDNNFHHIVITYAGSSLASGVKIYVDNVLQSLTTHFNTLTGTILNLENMNIASRRNGDSNFRGYLDEIVIYNKELTPEEVELRYNSGAGTESVGYDNTKGWYVRTDSNQIDTSSWNNIGKILVEETTPENTQIRYLVSIEGHDSGANYKKWNGASWETVDLGDIDSEGMSKTQLEALTDSQWNKLFVGGSGSTLDIVASLKTTNSLTTPELNQITIYYLTGYRHLCYDDDLKIEFIDATHTKITNTISPAETLYGLKVNVFMLTPF